METYCDNCGNSLNINHTTIYHIYPLQIKTVIVYTYSADILEFTENKYMKILVAYGTLSGNTQVVAESIAQYLSSKGQEVDLKNQEEIGPDYLLSYPFVIIGGSTWDEGNSNPATTAFLEKVNGSQMDYSAVKFGVFGLGETNYAHFCTVTDHISDAVKAKGGHIVGEPFKIDGYPDDTVLGNVHTWVDTVIAGA